MKLTEWYPGDVKPVRVGVYMRSSFWTGNDVYSRWDGQFWYQYHSDKEMAAKNRIFSEYQELTWRGVAK